MKLFKKNRCEFCGNKIKGLQIILKCDKVFKICYDCFINDKLDCESKIYFPKIVADKIEKI